MNGMEKFTEEYWARGGTEPFLSLPNGDRVLELRVMGQELHARTQKGTYVRPLDGSAGWELISDSYIRIVANLQECLRVAQRENEALREGLSDLLSVQDEECRLDHHGYCQ